MSAAASRASVWWVALGYYAGFFLLWTISHELSDMHETRYALYFDWETRIPFQAWVLPLYFSLDVAVALFPFAFRSWREALPPMGTLLAQTAIAAPFFVFIPIGPGYVNDMSSGVWGAYLFEPLGLANVSQWNHLPSLHVAYAFTLAWAIGPRWRTWAMIWATAVSASTMLVHEHHLICVITGFVLFLVTITTVYPFLQRCSILRA